MLQALGDAATHLIALLVYPGLLTVVAFGSVVEAAWTRVAVRTGAWPELPRRRPGLAVVTVALCAMLAAVQLAAPLSPTPDQERSVVLAAAGLLFTTWAELALTVEYAAEPGLMLLVQLCWLLSVLGPAVQPESLRPQVLGNVAVPGLLPVKIASAMLYLLCLPALLRLWPMTPHQDRRMHHRIDAVRLLCWFPYCGLFTTLFITPSSDDALGALRFFAATLLVAALTAGIGFALRRRGAARVRELYTRAVAPYALLVLIAVMVTSILMR
jgi:hypothetical protein